MRNKLLILSCFLSISFWAQNTYVPDDNFEQALIDLGYDNVLDDYVLTSNINSITSLYISNKEIQDLTGIESFTSLQELFVSKNALTTINLSSNIALKRLEVNENQLTSIDVSNNVNLTILFLSFNQLTSIDLSNNTKIFSLKLGHNQFTSLDLSKNSELQYFYAQWNQLKSMDLSLNTKLIGVWIENNQFTEVNIKNGNNGIITHFSVTNNPDLKCITVDYITNNRPWSWAKDNTATYNTDCTPKTYVPDDNFEQALIDLGYDDVLDDYVVTSNINSLKSLNVVGKNIIDLTGIEDFTSIEYLSIFNNKITSLDLSNNTNLINLVAYNNELTNVNLSNNSALIYLSISANNISALDLSSSVALESFYANSNKLEVIDLSMATSLKYFVADENALTSLNLKNGNNTNFITFSVKKNPDLTCIQVDDATYSLMNWSNFKDNTAQFKEDCTIVYTQIPDSNFEKALINLGLDSLLDGKVETEQIATLYSLNVSGKNITDLTGIEEFSSLEILDATQNKLASIDLSNNTSLKFLKLNYNNISSIDLSSNTELLELHIYHNELTGLDLSSNIKLKVVDAFFNKLTSIDVTNCLELKSLGVWYNQLSTINVTKNSKLENLNFESNNLTSVDISNNPLLKYLYAIDNSLSGIDLTNNTSIEYVHINKNNLNTIDVSNNVMLKLLQISDNNISNLDLSKNTMLTDLSAVNNNLESFTIKNGNNINVSAFYITNNPSLYCVEVDDAAYSNTNWTSVDDIVTFRESCTNFDDTLNRFDDNVTGNWNDAANWSLGHVPSSGEVIEIPSTSNITINKDDVVEVEKIISSGYITLNGKLTISDKYVNTGAVNFNSSGSLITTKATGTGTYILNKNTYKGYDLHPDNWYLVALPGDDIVAQSVISNSTLATGTGTNKGLAVYDNSSSINGGWRYLSSTSQDILQPGIGFATKMTSNSSMYLRKFQSNIDSEFLVKDYNITITNGSENGWNLIGNPYLAPIPANNSADGSSFLEMNESKLDPAYAALYFWNPNTNSYDVVNKATRDNYIEPMEGFFVKVANPVEQVAFKSSSLVHLPEAISSRAQNSAVEISLIVEGGEKRKKTIIKYLENSTKGLDVGYDAGLFNAEKESFSVYSSIEGDTMRTPLTIQCLPESELYGGKIAIGVKASEGEEITISALSANLTEGTVLLLEDTLKNVFVDVSKPESVYKTMLVSEEEGSNRFFLHTVSKTLSNDDNLNEERVKIIKTDSNHLLINGLEEKGEVFIYNIEGKLVSHEKINPVNNTVSFSNKAHGVYIVNLVMNNKRVTKKIVL